MIGYKPEISNSLRNIANCYYSMKDSLNIALEYLKESVALEKELRNYTGLANSMVLSGKIYHYSKDYRKAVTLLEEGLALAKEYNSPEVLTEASGALSDLYADLKVYEKAYANNKLFHELNDSVMNRENLKRITQLEMQYNFDKEQNETEFQHMQEKLEFESRLRRIRMAWIYSVFFGIVLIAFGIYIYRSYRKSQKANKEKEALLKEIHHRVKNNLQVVSSLLNLQSGTINDDSTRAAVKESQSRVKSMALIHQLLYQSELFTGIDFSKYLDQLMSNLDNMYARPGKDIQYSVVAENVEIDIDMAIPLGLITNELASNAYKYAFEGRDSGKIDIVFSKNKGGNLLFCISDNGNGFPEHYDPKTSNTLGLKLVRLLTKQLEGTLDVLMNNGTEFKLMIPYAG
jgi:two-component sensor histidine kinase